MFPIRFRRGPLKEGCLGVLKHVHIGPTIDSANLINAEPNDDIKEERETQGKERKHASRSTNRR